jgi:oxygen-independent coproporphyrinogen-3 oxidase
MIDTIDIKLLRKYDVPAPRYTSYPPAPFFNNSFTVEDYYEAIRINNIAKNSSDLSLYFHIPFCDTLCYFCGCNMIVSRDQARMRRYLDYLIQELIIIRGMLAEGRKVVQMHWGGGSPSNLSPENIIYLGSRIKELFNFSSDAEIGVEVDPRNLSYEHVKAFHEVGFNRISIGVQDFNPEIQKIINREQSVAITEQSIQWARALGFKSINIDLIYGLPLQTAEKFEDTLDIIIKLAPERIAVFNFAYVPWIKPHQKLIKREWLPQPEEKVKLLIKTIQKLSDAGYMYIGMDHFAKPNDELAIAQKNKMLYRNFQGYSTHANADLYAFGISSISQFENIYSQNYKNIKQYYEFLNEGRLPVYVGYKLTEDDVIRREVIMKLMCQMELDISYIEKKYNIIFDEYFAESIEKLKILIDDGLLRFENKKLIVSFMGRLLIRNIAYCFDAHSDKLRAEKQIFSKSV